ncbi:hypothetical protein LXL04_026570 [Taraxacum kok-saghyz]
MNGQELFWFVVNVVPQTMEANQRITDGVAKKVKFPNEKVLSNLDKYGNTSAASIPLALDEAVQSLLFLGLGLQGVQEL